MKISKYIIDPKMFLWLRP